MKKTFLIITMALFAISSLQAQIVEEMNLPDYKKFIGEEIEGVTFTMHNISSKFGVTDNIITRTVKRNAESGLINSFMAIVPFEGNKKDLEPYIKTAVDEFVKTQATKAYNFGIVGPSQVAGYHFSTLTDDGDVNDPSSNLLLLKVGENANLVYIEVKNSENPMLRNFYAIKWSEGVHLGLNGKVESETIAGTLYTIISKRPDVIEREQQSKQDKQQQAQAGPKSESELMEKMPDGVKIKMTLLDNLQKEYNRQIEDLRNLIINGMFENVIKEDKKSVRKQIKILEDKRQQVLDEMHNLIMGMDIW